MKKLILSTLVLTSFNGMAGSLFLTVGDDAACDYSTIQDAINNADNNSTVRIASNKVYFENVTIDDIDLVLTGGYADCTNANNNITDLSSAIVDGSDGFSPVVSIIGDGQTREVEIRNLLIGNGGAGLTSNANVDLTLKDSTLINNSNFGSVFQSGNQSITFDGVTVTGNSSSGVMCSGDNNSIRIQGDSLISDNETINNGGGLLITNGCDANVVAPVVINNNTAANHGGGINVSNGSLVNLNGIEINQNTADVDEDNIGNGGGIYIADELSIVNAVNVKFLNNQASRGGAVSVASDGRFTSFSVNSAANPCLTPGECSEYRGNSAVNIGGVLHATGNGEITALHGNFRQNGLFGDGLIAFASTGASIGIEGSVIVKNGSESLPATNLFFVDGEFDSTTNISLNHVTVADNDILESVINNDSGIFALYASIIDEEADVSEASNVNSHSFECAIVHETGSFSAGGTVIIDDPKFINAATGDYHIQPISPAVDYCYSAAPLTVDLGYDLDFEGRNYDDPNVADLHGQYDVGAYEYRFDNDLIFMNGFEEE